MSEQPTPSPAASWQQLRRAVVMAVAVDAAVAALLVLTGSGGLFRGTAVFLFFLLGPGLAVTGFMRLTDVSTELAVAVPLSLALSTVVAGAMSTMTEWRPDAALLGSVLVTVPPLAAQLLPGRRPRAAPEIEPRLASPAESEGPAATRVALPIDGAEPVRAVEPAEPRERVNPARLAELRLPPVDWPDRARTARTPGPPDRLPGFWRAPVNGHPTDVPVNGAAARTPANGLGDGRHVPVRSLAEEIGRSLIELARREVRADSAAVLVPDAGTWIVISGVNLPDQNGTLRITAAHELIREVLYGDRRRIVRGSERRPGDLAGLPLPASDHVLALALPESETVILLSRGHPPFHREELRLLTRILALQGTMLDLALKMRKLGKDLDEVFEESAGPVGLRRGAGDSPTGS